MTCAYLIGIYLKSCSATPDVYIPSAFEFNEYCRSVFHTLCPLYRPRQSQDEDRAESQDGAPGPPSPAYRVCHRSNHD
jgi:hypothetical protein